MGTRHITMVVIDGQPKVAQYGQWDGYPSGAGTTCLEFLRANPDLTEFRERVRALITFTPERLRQIDKAAGIPEGAPGITREQANARKLISPALSRDTGADILELVRAGTVQHVVTDLNFVNDSLFCEWAYVIDLDTSVFEVYKGVQQTAHTLGRFAKPEPTDGYYPVALAKSYPLAALPDEDTFVKDFQEPDEES